MSFRSIDEDHCPSRIRCSRLIASSDKGGVFRCSRANALNACAFCAAPLVGSGLAAALRSRNTFSAYASSDRPWCLSEGFKPRFGFRGEVNLDGHASKLGTRRPCCQALSRIIRMSGATLSTGIGEHNVDGVRVRITSPARTVVDCFKFRNKIGVDVAVEALKDYRRLRKGSVDALWQQADRLRMSKVIRPYWEAMSS